MMRRIKKDDEPLFNNESDNDSDIQLEKIGYKQELYRGLDGLMCFAIGFTEVGALVSVTSVFTFGLMTGGPTAMVWGWLLSFFFTMIVALNFAEICSAYPCAGGPYHWSGILATKEIAPAAAYWTGLFNWLGNSAFDSSFAFTFSIFVSAALELQGYDSLSTGDEVALAIGVLLVWDLLNILRIDEIGWITNVAALIQLGTVIALIAVVLSYAPSYQSVDFVFFQYYNDTGFSIKSYVIAISILFGMYGFDGYDASAHMAEETTHSRTSAPLAILYTCFFTGIAGFGLILGLLFATQDIQSAIDGATGNAAIQIIYQCTDATTAAVFSWLIALNCFFGGVSSVTVTARVSYALFRDKVSPYSEVMSALHPTLLSPVNAIIFMFFTQALILLLPLISSGGDTAFYSIISLGSIGLQISYAIPIVLKCTTVLEPKHHSYITKSLEATPMTLGVWSLPLGIVASIWLLATSGIFLLPTTDPITASSMNYSIVVIFFVFVLGWLNWEYNSKYYFKGPKRIEDTDGGGDFDQNEAAADDVAISPPSISAAGGGKGGGGRGGGSGGATLKPALGGQPEATETWRLIAAETQDTDVRRGRGARDNI